MYKFLNVALIICAGMCAAIVCASAQSEGQNANGKPAADVRPLVDYSPIIAKLKKQLPQQMVESNVPGLAIALVDGVPYFVRPNSTTASSFKFLAGEPLKFSPGSEYFYSSAGFFLLGMIIEKVSGSRYANFLAEQFFQPLGMNSTAVVGHTATLKNRSACHTVRNGKPYNWGCYEESDELPASYGVLSTVRDLAKWDMALAAGKLVKEPGLAAMWTPVKLNGGSSYPYGFGWEVQKFFGRRMITHGGAMGTEYTFLPDDRLTVIVLTNLGGDGANS